jgi:hypothetical protein
VDLKSLFCKNENKSWMAYPRYFFKNLKFLAKYLNKLFCFRRFPYKCHFLYDFDDNLSVNNVFIKQIFRAVEISHPFPLPLPPPPTGLRRGWGRSGDFHPQAAVLVMTMMHCED